MSRRPDVSAFERLRSNPETQRPTEAMLGAYDVALTSEFSEHRKGLTLVTDRYNGQLEPLAGSVYIKNQACVDTHARALDDAKNGSQQAFDESAERIGNFFAAVPVYIARTLEEEFGSTEVARFRRYWEISDLRGIDSNAAAQLLGTAPSHGVQLLMEMGRDALVFQQAMERSRVQGLESRSALIALENASCPAAKNLMLAARDKLVHEKFLNHSAVRSDASTTDEILYLASCDDASYAMMVGRDSMLFDNYASIVKSYGIHSRQANDYLTWSSGGVVPTVMKRALEIKLNLKQRNSVPDTDVENILRKAANVPKEVKGKPTQYPHRWLSRIDRSDARRVISSVKAMRKNADAKGETITDFEIYLRYRRAIEQPKNGTVSPEVERSFKILSAMMNDDPRRGKLPF